MIGNLTVLDLKNVKRVDPSKFYSKTKFSPYEGWELVGWPVATIIRSNLVFLEGEVYYENFRGVNACLHYH